ncbi:MAG TPA: PQQ-dependent sugar dehydrogenase [Actinomycetota bacterium]|nr:PQQ-dependent sugar dehydrogenase [Actinomycetota bacterium]
MTRRRTAALLASLLLVGACSSPSDRAEPHRVEDDAGEVVVSSATSGIDLKRIASGLADPLGVTHAPGRRGVLFIVEQGGTIRIWKDGELRTRPFLDITELVQSGGEQGLLGLAFHPRYARNGRFFVDYTAVNGDSVIARYKRSSSANVASPGSAKIILRFEDPFPNHNGGHLAFGPDGYLYIASGDGGSGGDPMGNGQRLDTLLGKILRIDVNAPGSGRPYGIPPDNPFAGTSGARPEIWSYGLRNPWRFSFDRANGNMWIGDVGQSALEEIDLEPRNSDGGVNYGWNVREGNQCYPSGTQCGVDQLRDYEDPVAVYSHDFGCSVTGGFVYRGPQDALRGRYFFGDYCSGTIWSIDGTVSREQEPQIELESGLSISSFGEDTAGNVYITDLSGGELFKVRPAP